ncbi:lysophospholipid acyltransferase family protein [Patescibacteria group bacterium]|nr:lysophospholipid acyltransferase family protein [Patescibacteria group bacterium]
MKKSSPKGLEELKWKLIGIFGKLLVNLLFKTTRIEAVGFEKVEPIINSRRFIFAFWHSRILLINYLYQGWNAAVLVSQSQDGEFIARVAQRQGHEPIRGSTTRGGLRALSQMIKSLKEKRRPAGIIPDGPQGPRFKVQPGIIILAKKTGFPIVPVTYSASRVKVFNSWDHFLLPFPFAQCRIVYGDPVSVPGNADPETVSACRLSLEQELCRITTTADRFYGHMIS